MKSQGIFWLLAILVFSILGITGLFFYGENTAVFWIIEGMALFSVVLFVVLYSLFVKPYKLLLTGMELLKQQDFTNYLRPVKHAEASRLIDIFNKMIGQLHKERLEVREKNHFLDLLVKASPQGVIILDFDYCIVEVNPTGIGLLKVSGLPEIKGKKLSEVNSELAGMLSRLLAEDDQVVRTSDGAVYRCIRSGFYDSGFNHPFLLIEELTQGLRKMEKEAYENIIRMMSHEVNNSVGTIGSTLYVVSDIIKQQDEGEWADVLPVVEASYERCGHLAGFTRNLAGVVKIPAPSFSEISLNELVKSVDALVRIECRKRGIHLLTDLSEEDVIICVDGIQFEQILVNILKNAYEATGPGGTIRIITRKDPASIVIEDNGHGITAEAKEKLFTPFFTTKTSGQGIGLMFVREVLLNHTCIFSLKTENGITRFSIVIPY